MGKKPETETKDFVWIKAKLPEEVHYRLGVYAKVHRMSIPEAVASFLNENIPKLTMADLQATEYKRREGRGKP
jgi:hypothetical protein